MVIINTAHFMQYASFIHCTAETRLPNTSPSLLSLFKIRHGKSRSKILPRCQASKPVHTTITLSKRYREFSTNTLWPQNDKNDVRNVSMIGTQRIAPTWIQQRFLHSPETKIILEMFARPRPRLGCLYLAAARLFSSTRKSFVALL